MVKAQLEATWDLKAEDIEIYYLDLIQFRSVSNLIADRLGVWHHSPQLILLKEGKATYNASHQAIRTDKDREALTAKVIYPYKIRGYTRVQHRKLSMRYKLKI